MVFIFCAFFVSSRFTVFEAKDPGWPCMRKISIRNYLEILEKYLRIRKVNFDVLLIIKRTKMFLQLEF